jgi:hypothetical protein
MLSLSRFEPQTVQLVAHSLRRLHYSGSKEEGNEEKYVIDIVDSSEGSLQYKLKLAVLRSNKNISI